MTEPEPRSNLIDNAVKFLQDPQVRASSLSKQLNFLESKGLTLREVEEAMKRAGVTTHNDKVAVIVPSSEEGHPPPLPQSPPPNRLQLERSFSWGRFLLTLALIGSASVALSQSVLLVLMRITIIEIFLFLTKHLELFGKNLSASQTIHFPASSEWGKLELGITKGKSHAGRITKVIGKGKGTVKC